MENFSFNWKKFAGISALVVVIAIGAVLGTGRYLKGSFSGSVVVESSSVPAPTNVAVTKDANGQYVLTWSYKKSDEEASHYFYTDASGKAVHVAAFEWVLQDASGSAVWSTNSGLATATSPSGNVCKQKLSHDINETTETEFSFVCHDVYLDADVVSSLIHDAQYTVRVRADLGGRNDHAENEISSPGVAQFSIPAPVVLPPKLDFVNILPDGTFTWGWNDSDNPFRAGSDNSLYQLHEEFAFNYVWKLIDDTDHGKGKLIWERGANDDPKIESLASECYKEMGMPVEGKKVWACKKTAILAEVAQLMIPEHTYIFSVAIDNGKEMTAYTSSQPYVLPPIVTDPKPVDEVIVILDEKTGAPLWFAGRWNDRDYKPSASSTLLQTSKDEYVFSYFWKIVDATNPQKEVVVFEKKNDDDPGVEPLIHDPPLKGKCYIGKLWTCEDAYIPTSVTFTPGHTYIFQVAVFNGYGMTTYTSSKPVKIPVPEVTEILPKLDSLTVTQPSKSGDLATFEYGWKDAGIVPSSKYTKIVDASGKRHFVFRAFLVDDETGKTVWHNQLGKAVTQPLKAGYESCLTTIGGTSYWTCQKGYIPSSVTLTPGKKYTLSVAAVFQIDADGAVYSSGNITNTFTPADPLPAPTNVKVMSSIVKGSKKYELTWDYPNDISQQSYYAKWANAVVPNPGPGAFIGYSIFNWVIEDSTGKIIWTPDVSKVDYKYKGIPFQGSTDLGECATALTHKITKVVKNNVYRCRYVYIDDAIIASLIPDATYTLKVWADNGLTDAAGKPILSAPGAGTFVAPKAPGTASVSGLVAKRQSDGSVAVSYSVNLSGVHVAPTFTSEVRVGGSKDFAVQFVEARKNGVSSYDYQAVLLPWEINNGDKITVAVSSSDLSAEVVSSIDYKFTEIQKVALGFASTALPSGTVGSAYNATIALTGGVSPYKFIVLDGSMLPPGISVGATGVVSGTPGAHGQFAIKVSVVDGENSNLVGTVSLSIAPQPASGGGGGGVAYSSGCYGPCPTGSASGPIVNVPPLQANPLKFTFVFNYTPAPFKDIVNHWAKTYVSALFNAGIVKGYSDLRFGPDDSVTRAQLLKIVMTSLKYPLPDRVDVNPCYDVSEAVWYAKYFAAAKKYGIVGGYPDGSCRPNQVANRAEAIKILFTAIEKMPWHAVNPVSVDAAPVAAKTSVFKDVVIGSWYSPTFTAAIRYGIIQGFAAAGGNEARPEAELSRGQLAKIIVVTLQKLAGATSIQPVTKVVPSLFAPYDSSNSPIFFAWGYDATESTSSANTILRNESVGDYFSTNNYSFDFAWKLTDVTDSKKPILIYKRDHFEPAPKASASILNHKSYLGYANPDICYVPLTSPEQYRGKHIWRCYVTYIPEGVSLIKNHAYVFSLDAFNGVHYSGYADSTPIIAK